MLYNQWRRATTASTTDRASTTSVPIGSIFNFQVQERFAHEVRLTTQGESSLQWMVGAFLR